MTEDDTKAIACIKRYSGLKDVCRVSIFEGTNPETKEKVMIKVYDHGMEAGDDRYWIEAENKTSRAISQNFRRMDDALEFLDWEKL
ncbi:hypothetical protein HZB74_01580 [Candidatus Saccharibacteria bacterium]|nr:hypothetical protein [Candidatus Saccharibacteria bacterium]